MEEPLILFRRIARICLVYRVMGRPELLIGTKYVSDLRYRIFVLIPGQVELLATAPLHLINVP